MAGEDSHASDANWVGEQKENNGSNFNSRCR